MNKPLIIIVYFPHNIRGDRAASFMHEMQNYTDPTKEKILILGVPSNRNEYKIECINPELISEEKYKEAEEIINNLKEKYVRKTEI